MLSDNALARLSQLARAAPPPDTRRRPPRSVSAAEPDSLAVDQDATSRGTLAARIAALEISEPPARGREESEPDRLPGREVENPAGRHWIIERPIEELWPTWERHLERQRRRPDRAATASATTDNHPQRECLARSLPRDVLLLDLETCGFAGAMVFLVGAIHHRDDRLWLTQWMARNYAEERAMLYSLWEVVPHKPLLVTFNGKSFDWPVVRDRTTLHRLDQLLGLSSDQVDAAYRQRGDHCDILHHARRHWKGQLPNFRLQTLERHVCGRRREGDIPGKLIPDAYHDFVRTGDPFQIRSILHHNALDLLTLLQVSVVLS